MADAISSISTSAGSECETVEVAQMSEAGQTEQLFKNGEVQFSFPLLKMTAKHTLSR